MQEFAAHARWRFRRDVGATEPARHEISGTKNSGVEIAAQTSVDSPNHIYCNYMEEFLCCLVLSWSAYQGRINHSGGGIPT